jgi:hypothetical protein
VTYWTFWTRILAKAAAIGLATSATLLGATVGLTNATAAFSQPPIGGFPLYHPSYAIDINLVNDVGWGIFPQTGTQNVAVFETIEDIGFVDGSVIRVALHQLHLNPRHTLGRFRISVTQSPRNQFADGLPTGGSVSANWTALTPTRATSTNGTTLSILSDSSVLASGSSPAQEVYFLEFETSLTLITGFRIEVIPDNSLPGNGPGRAINGNFLLTEISAEILPRYPTLDIQVSEVQIKWDSSLNRVYQIQYSEPGTIDQWTNAAPVIPGTGGILTYSDRTSAASQRQYRVISRKP